MNNEPKRATRPLVPLQMNRGRTMAKNGRRGYFRAGGQGSPRMHFTAECMMHSDNQIDLKAALQKIHELAMADGNLGYAYWYKVGQVLRRGAEMQSEIDMLAKQLDECRAQLCVAPSKKSTSENLKCLYGNRPPYLGCH
ncbi:hypothetical protein [Burkholderia multivorans]|uniref:hypothetical protein n=1 Tax=Burkholderia multivorans TaxID=87883 RepID=UPI001B8E05BC|nr:hypothetical protein [Burkholderia multivorans]MBR7896904.1 hypothetical protein [Burkholderia multivorans]